MPDLRSARHGAPRIARAGVQVDVTCLAAISSPGPELEDARVADNRAVIRGENREVVDRGRHLGCAGQAGGDDRVGNCLQRPQRYRLVLTGGVGALSQEQLGSRGAA